MKSRIPKASRKVRDSPISHHLGCHRKSNLHNCIVYSEGLGQPHASSLVVRSDSVSSYEPMSVDPFGFLWARNMMDQIGGQVLKEMTVKGVAFSCRVETWCKVYSQECTRMTADKVKFL